MGRGAQTKNQVACLLPCALLFPGRPPGFRFLFISRDILGSADHRHFLFDPDINLVRQIERVVVSLFCA